MINAKGELLDHVGNKDIFCLEIQKREFNLRNRSNPSKFSLTTGWTKEDWEQLLIDLDFDYDSGYGSQVLFGTIWYVDGTWSLRGEYDGSEWWEYNKCPEIPAELNRIDKVRNKKLNQIL